MAGRPARPWRARSSSWLTSNALAAALALVAIAFYAVGYTMLLKRRTPQNIVWGGAAGCMPVLIAWAAVTGSLSWTPVVLFLIIFFWTPPHYWPLAMRFKDDYAAAGVPMLPVVRTDGQVANSIIVYTWVMVATSLVLVPVAPMGWVYGIGADLLGAAFLWEAYLLQAAHRRRLRHGHGHRDAAVPRVDHVPGAAVPAGRARPVRPLAAGPTVSRRDGLAPRPQGRRDEQRGDPHEAGAEDVEPDEHLGQAGEVLHVADRALAERDAEQDPGAPSGRGAGRAARSARPAARW